MTDQWIQGAAAMLEAAHTAVLRLHCEGVLSDVTTSDPNTVAERMLAAMEDRYAEQARPSASLPACSVLFSGE